MLKTVNEINIHPGKKQQGGTSGVWLRLPQVWAIAWIHQSNVSTKFILCKYTGGEQRLTHSSIWMYKRFVQKPLTGYA